MTDWRYWITYEGRVQTPRLDEDEARTAALRDLRERETPWCVIEVELISPKSPQVEAIDNAGN